MDLVVRRVVPALLLAVCAAAAGAQSGPLSTIKVRVVDSVNGPIAGAEVTVVEGLHDVIAAGTSDAAGRVTLQVKRADAQRELIARKIGLTRASMFFRPSRDSVGLLVYMHSPVRILETMQVTAREDVKRKSYHVDADDIAASNRPIFDGMDVLTKLRPDILYGRMPGCGVENVWINGKLIRGVMSSPMVQARRPLTPSAARNQSGRPPVMPRLLSANEAALTIMASIHPEHIEEMNFLDCFDTSINKLHGNAALYVVLKTGIAFEVNGRGSYVKEMPVRAAVEEAIASGAGPAASASAAVPDAAGDVSYRRRVLGVFDEATGEAVAGAVVADSATGTSATTTATGTVSLAFLPDGGSTLRVSKPGFAELRIGVTISPRDTLPITLLLSRPR